MAFPVVQTKNSGNTGATTKNHTINLPTGITAGDLLIVVFSVDTAPTITWPEGWTQIFFLAYSTNNTLDARFRRADGTEGATILITTLTNVGSSHTSYRITGYNSASNPEAGTTTSGSSANPDPPNLIPSWGAGENLWIATYGWNDGRKTNSSYPANFTDNQIADGWNNSSGSGIATCTQNLVAPNIDPGLATLSGSIKWIANTMVVRPIEVANYNLLMLMGVGT